MGLAEGLIRKSPKRIQTTQEGTFDDYRKCDKARRDFDAAHPTGGMQWVCACQEVLHSDKEQDKRKRVTGVAEVFWDAPARTKSDAKAIQALYEKMRQQDTDANINATVEDTPEPKIPPKSATCATSAAAVWSWLVLLPWVRRRR